MDFIGTGQKSTYPLETALDNTQNNGTALDEDSYKFRKTMSLLTAALQSHIRKWRIRYYHHYGTIMRTTSPTSHRRTGILRFRASAFGTEISLNLCSE